MAEEAERERQSRVSRSGRKWEEYVRLYLEEKLKCDVEVLRGEEKAVKGRSEILWKLLSPPIRSTIKDKVWGDIDLIAVRGEIPVAIISCKESLHARLTETLFWSVLFRASSHIKVVLATPDKGYKDRKGNWRSEWGTPENPSQNRLLAETYLDGVYVENVEGFSEARRQGKSTATGGIVRPLSELPDDLCRWAENCKFVYIRKSEESE